MELRTREMKNKSGETMGLAKRNRNEEAPRDQDY